MTKRKVEETYSNEENVKTMVNLDFFTFSI